jgi:hypothetical protein
MVQEAGEPVDQIYFPQTGMISLLVVTQEGIGIEAASIGCEGAHCIEDWENGVHSREPSSRYLARCLIFLLICLNALSVKAIPSKT